MRDVCKSAILEAKSRIKCAIPHKVEYPLFVYCVKNI